MLVLPHDSLTHDNNALKRAARNKSRTCRLGRVISSPPRVNIELTHTVRRLHRKFKLYFHWPNGQDRALKPGVPESIAWPPHGVRGLPLKIAIGVLSFCLGDGVTPSHMHVWDDFGDAVNLARVEYRHRIGANLSPRYPVASQRRRRVR